MGIDKYFTPLLLSTAYSASRSGHVAREAGVRTRRDRGGWRRGRDRGFITLDDNATWCFKAPKSDPNCTAEYRLRPVPCPSRFPPLKEIRQV
jgi:hypothetical protein